MENVIKIKTSETEELVGAVLIEHANVHLSVFEHCKGKSTYILTTKDIQGVFDLGKAFGIALAEAGKAEKEKEKLKQASTRGKGHG